MPSGLGASPGFASAVAAANTVVICFLALAPCYRHGGIPFLSLFFLFPSSQPPFTIHPLTHIFVLPSLILLSPPLSPSACMCVCVCVCVCMRVCMHKRERFVFILRGLLLSHCHFFYLRLQIPRLEGHTVFASISFFANSSEIGVHVFV